MSAINKLKYQIVAILLAFCCWPLHAQQSGEQMASYYYQNKEYDKAIELYEPLYEKTQNQFYYQMLYACYSETMQWKEAEKLVEKRIKKQQRDLTLYVDLGKIYISKGEKKKSEKQYATAVEKLGRDSKQTTDLAMAFENAGRMDFAIATYLKSRENLQNEYLYVMELATLYGKAGDYEKMMGEYFNLLDKSPGNMGSIQLALSRSLNETSSTQLAEGLRRTLVSRIRQHPDNKTYLEMMIWFSLQQKDFDFALTQAQAVDARFPDLGGEQVMRVAQIAQNNEDWATAEKAYRHLVAKGKEHARYFDSRVGLLDVGYRRISRSYAADPKALAMLTSEYDAALDELGKNDRTVQLMRNYAHLLAYSDATATTENLQRAADLLQDIIDMPRIPAATLAEVKLELGDLLLFAGEIWDASLLYSQVEKSNKNDVVGAKAKFKNAKLSYYNNDFQWAKSQLDVLRASTSKLIANDAMELSLLISDNMEEDSTYDMLELYAAADLMLYQGKLDSAWVLLDDITHRTLNHPLFDEILVQKARIRMRQGRYAEADSLLQFVVDHYGSDILADDALFMLAELNEQKLDNANKAQECYEKLVLDYPSSLYVDRARKKLKR